MLDYKKLGKPRTWETPEDLEKEIISYFEEVDQEKSMPTKAGLSLHLHTSRKSLGDYMKRDDYRDCISEAYSLIEIAWSQRLSSSTPTGSIFYLKAAFHYKDRMDVTSDDKAVEGNKIIFENFKKDDTESK